MRDNFPHPPFIFRSDFHYSSFLGAEKSGRKVNFHEKKTHTCICREVNVVRTLLPQAVEEEAAAETTTSPEAAAFVEGGSAVPAGVWETCAPESNYHPKQNTSAFIFYTLIMPIRRTSWMVSATAAAAAGGGGLQHCSNPGAVDDASSSTTLGADVRLRLILMPLPHVSPELEGVETVPPH